MIEVFALLMVEVFAWRKVSVTTSFIYVCIFIIYGRVIHITVFIVYEIAFPGLKSVKIACPGLKSVKRLLKAVFLKIRHMT